MSEQSMRAISRALEAERQARSSSGNGTAPRILLASEMSANQRNQTFDATIHRLNLIIVQVNALTQQVRQLSIHQVELSDELTALQASFVGQRGLKARLRWLVTGK